MLKSFKNFTSLRTFLKTVFLFSFLLLGLFLPIFPADAFISALAILVGGAIAWIVMAFILAISNIILAFVSVILMWSIDPWFIRVPYTSGGIVDIGWPVVRDLANMGIVLALVFIGLATALRLQEYQAQKTLPLLIGVALLINFTPVILGVIIDAANIVMNFFLAEITGGELIMRRFTSLGAMISSNLGSIGQFFNPLQHWSLAFQILIIVIFNFFAGLIFLLFALLFIMRRVVIWILVILSPLAFVSYIFPATRGFWRMWWNQFWQWTIIGVFAAFFLFLGEQMIQIASQGGFAAEVPGGGPEGFLATHVIDVFNQVLPYGVALIFLLFGFFLALSTSAMGATGIVAGAQKFGGAATAWAGRQARKRGTAAARKKWEESETVRPRVEAIAKRMAEAKTPEITWGKGEKGPIAWAQRRAAGVAGATATPIWAGARAAGRTVGPGFIESGKREMEEAEKEVEKASVDMVISKFRSAADWATKTGYINRLIKKNDLDEAFTKGLQPTEVDQTLQQAEKYDAHQEIVSAYPTAPSVRARMAAIAGAHGISVAQAYAQPIPGVPEAGLISRIKASRAGQVSRQVLTQPDIMEAIVRSWDGRHVGPLINAHGREAVQAIEGIIRTRAAAAGVSVDDWMNLPAYANNPKLLSYMRSSAGRSGMFTL